SAFRRMARGRTTPGSSVRRLRRKSTGISSSSPTTWNHSSLQSILGDMPDVTRLLSAAARGDSRPADQLLPLVYEQLRDLAARQLAHEKPGQTLDATALVHEAYLRLIGVCQFTDRRHFFRVAAEAMRRVLIDRARQRQRVRHGGACRQV